MKRILIGSLICAFFAGCGGGPAEGPEEAVRAWVAAAEIAAEEKDRSGLMDMIAEHYADSRGNDRAQIEAMLRFYFLRHKSIGFVSNINDISVMGDTAALVNLTAVGGGTDANALGISADAYNFELELEYQDDEWALIGARWGRVGQEMR
jgi:hypothetical protein